MSALWDLARTGRAVADLEVIDIHGHLGRYDFAIPDPSPAGLVAAMDRIGVRTIVCSHMSCMHGDVGRGNDEVLAACRAHPGRILGYVTVWPADAAEVAAEARRRFAQGFVGVKLHNSNGFAYTDAVYAPALAMADERRMPVVLHTWAMKEELKQVRELAGRYPGASFLLAHAGAVEPARHIQAAREMENVYLDTCFSRAPRGLIERLVAEAGPEKVLWGSDAVFLSQTQQIGRVLGAAISEDDKGKLLSTNARRLLDRVRR